MSPFSWYGRLKTELRRGRNYLENDLWYHPLPPLRSKSGLILRLVRFIHLIVIGFREDRLRMHAASLTFSTLMALLPLLAIVLSIADGFGQHEVATSWLLNYTKDMPEHFETLVRNLIDLVSQTDFAKLGALGGLSLLFMTIQVLSRIEASFNQIWNLAQSRTWLRRVSNYISIVVIVPILLLGAITVTANLKWGDASSVWNLLSWLPYLALWIAFSFLYGALPNTRVSFLAALAGGLMGALLWQGWFKLYILLQPGITRYNVLYGALASIPIFLAWLSVSWQIILLGCRITYAVQAGGATLPQLSRRHADIRTRMLIALTVMVDASRSLQRKTPPLTRKGLVKHYSLNPKLLDDVLVTLTEAELLTETSHEPPRLLPALDPNQITVRMLIDAWLYRGDPASELGIDQLDPSLIELLNKALNQGGDALDACMQDLAGKAPVPIAVLPQESLS